MKRPDFTPLACSPCPGRRVGLLIGALTSVILAAPLAAQDEEDAGAEANRLCLSCHEDGDTMAPTPLLDCIHTDDRALFAGTLFEAARSSTPFCLRLRFET